MLTVKKFGVWPMIMMMTLSVGIVNHVIIVPLLLDAAGRDAWISALAAMPIVMLWAVFPLFAITKSMKGRPIGEWLDARGPSALKWVILVPLIALLTFTSFHSLTDAIEFANATYIPYTPSYIVTLLFVGLCAYGALCGLRTIAFVSCILLPIVVTLGDFVMTANTPHKDYRFMLPILEHGLGPVMNGTLFAVSALIEIYMLILFQSHLRGSISRSGIVILLAFLTLLALGPLTGTISQFGPIEGEKLRYPAFAQWRLVSIGRYIEHLDFFAIYQWLSGSFIRVSMTLYLASELLFRSERARRIGICLLSVVIGVSAVITIGNYEMYRVLLKAYFQYSGLLIFVLSLVLWGLTAARGGQALKEEGEEGA